MRERETGSVTTAGEAGAGVETLSGYERKVRSGQINERNTCHGNPTRTKEKKKGKKHLPPTPVTLAPGWGL